MPSAFIFTLLFSSIFCLIESKVFTVLLEGDSVFPQATTKAYPRGKEGARVHKEMLFSDHDIFLDSFLQRGTYTKLYSYTHLLNGFAVHVTNEMVVDTIRTAKGVRSIHEDVKIEKFTTHTPDFLGIPTGVWPSFGGVGISGEGVVIGLIDTGINPNHPSFAVPFSQSTPTKISKFKGKCTTGEGFPLTACNGKIIAAQYFARAAIVNGEFNATRDYASPFDADGHGSHTASIAAGNYNIPVVVNGYNYGFASGMAPGARISVYKALYPFGGYMSDVVAAVDQAIEDGVDILSLSVGPSSVPSGPSAFLNVLEMILLFATKAGVLVVQAVGNNGPPSSSVLSFSPWITSVAASLTDRKYANSILLGNGQCFTGTGLAPPTGGAMHYPIAAAMDVSERNTKGLLAVESCQNEKSFIPSLVEGKLIICTYTSEFEGAGASIATVAETIRRSGAAGFILIVDPDLGFEQINGTMLTLTVPGIILNNLKASSALWKYYNSRTNRSRSGQAVSFSATAGITEGRHAIYTGEAPVVASYSSRGPDVKNAALQAADVLKPNIMAPGSSIWGAWSPTSEGDPQIKGQEFALVSGTSMATPHIAGIAALIKQKHPSWSPSAITSAMMTTADVTDKTGNPILAQQTNRLVPANPFDFGSGAINPSRAIDPGLVFNTNFNDYLRFLCSLSGVDEINVKRALGVDCPTMGKSRYSDLNTASVVVSNLVGLRKVVRRVTNVGNEGEKYRIVVKEPKGVNITVTPQVFKIKVNGSRIIHIALVGNEVTNAYTFGEMLFAGDRDHVVRVPIAVNVRSSH